MDCAILGDSIGVGIAQASPRECYESVMGGRPSRLQRAFIPPSRLVIISIGANDGGQSISHTLQELARIRREVITTSNCLAWVIPNTPRAAAIREFARSQGDLIIETSLVVGPDRLHPSRAGYLRLWNEAAGHLGQTPPACGRAVPYPVGVLR